MSVDVIESRRMFSIIVNTINNSNSQKNYRHYSQYINVIFWGGWVGGGGMYVWS